MKLDRFREPDAPMHVGRGGDDPDGESHRPPCNPACERSRSPTDAAMKLIESLKARRDTRTTPRSSLPCMVSGTI